MSCIILTICNHTKDVRGICSGATYDNEANDTVLAPTLMTSLLCCK